MKKKCDFCGKEFGFRKWRRYCCERCREQAKLKREYESGKSQLCWKCQRACGGCPWSRELKPVKGWKAKLTTIRSNGIKEYNSYRIIECPLFVEDER